MGRTALCNGCQFTRRDATRPRHQHDGFCPGHSSSSAPSHLPLRSCLNNIQLLALDGLQLLLDGCCGPNSLASLPTAKLLLLSIFKGGGSPPFHQLSERHRLSKAMVPLIQEREPGPDPTTGSALAKQSIQEEDTKLRTIPGLDV